MLAYLLIYSTLNSLIHEAINLSVFHGSEAQALHRAIPLVIIIVLFLLTVTCNGFYFCYDRNLGDRNEFCIPVSLGVQTIGALLYLVGNNAPKIAVEIYQNDLGMQCDMNCLTAASIVGVVFVGLALLIFQVTPHLSHAIITEEKDDHWFTPMDSITTLVSLDALYSSVVMMIDPQSSCSEITRAVSWIFWVICVIGGWLFVAKMVYTADVLSEGECEVKMAITFMVLGMVCYPFYILLDNSLPLDCEFGCSAFNGNTTYINCHDVNTSMMGDVPCCEEIAKSGLKLFFAIAVLVITILSSLVLHCVYESQRPLGNHTHSNAESKCNCCLDCITRFFKLLCISNWHEKRRNRVTPM